MSHEAETKPLGGLYRFDAGEIRQMLGDIVVPNGPAISPNDTLLYHVDSPRRTIWRFRISADGTLVDGHVHIRIAEENGYPDGIVLDSEGCLWVCLWHGWGLRRYDPSGRLIQHIALPCSRVTKLAFGGADLTSAYVTTASKGLSETELAEQSDAGSLFVFDPGVSGLPALPVKTR